ncbi:MAG: hypothetical protein V7672_06405 [Brevundimonas sp.]|jgi:hypothetical protein|uniref:hypothetical protein n=1 Tax=Brevundimonas sp. TaxID=1871086 RepID=UPI0030027D16
MSALLHSPVPLWLVLLGGLGLVSGQAVVTVGAWIWAERSDRASRWADFIEASPEDLDVEISRIDANLISWGFGPEEREHLLRQCFGADVLRRAREVAAGKGQPSVRAQRAAPQADRGQAHA